MLVLSAGTAHALGDYLTQFTARYGNTGTEAASCKLCHAASNSGSSFNRYGVDLDARGGGAATGDITDNLIAVETLNSDGVGGTNLAEIQGGTQPGWCVATTAGCNNNGVTTLPAGVVNLPLDPTVAGNQPPGLNPIGAKTVNEGQPLTFTATATDPNGNALTFSGGNLPTGATLTPAGAFSWTPSFTQGQTTPYSVTITVTDNGSPVASDFETFTITVGNVNRPPVLAPIGAKTGTEGVLLAFTATATDPDGNALTFSAGGLPTGATLTPAGAFSWTPATGQAGNFNVTVTVTDTGGLIVSEIVTITVGNVNRPPVLAPIGAKTGTEGQPLTFTATATDPDGNALTFSAGGLPTGATLTPAGAFSWTPTFAQAGTYNVTITVTDNGSPVASDFEALTITVGNVNRPPVLTNPGNRAVAEGQLLTLALTASDPDGDLLVFSSSTLPNGASVVPGLTNGTATFSWTPAAGQASATPYSVTVAVTDPGGQVASQTFTITVSTTAPVNRAPTVTNPGNKTVTTGQPLSFTITGSDPDGNALTFSAGATLPAGATLNATTGAFSWTPAAGQASATPYSVTVTVTDNGSPALSASQTFTITVTAAPPATTPITMSSVTATQASPVVAGTALTLTATATGGTAPYQFKWWVWNGSAWSVARDWGTGNTLPWMPPAPGNYEVHAWVRNNGVTADAWQAWGRLAYTVTNNGVTVSSVTATQGSPLVAGTPLTLTATATGGTAPYQFKWWVWNGSAWSVARDWGTGNTLPWTPTVPGAYEVHAWVRNNGVTADTWQAWGRLAYTVTATPAPTMASVTANRTGIRPVGRSVTLTATATGGTAPYQFKWWVWNGSAWSVAQEWAPGNTLRWTPTAPGDYEVHAWVRNNGVTADTWQAWGRMVLTVAPQVQVDDD